MSEVVRTSVTVTNPTRGSLSGAATASARTCRMARSTRRMRSLPIVPSPARRSGELSLDLARRVDLEHVAFLDVLEVVEHDPALEPGADLADVVVEPAEAGDRRVGHDRPVPDQPDPGTPGDLALGD